jgi:O-glycosyl hydrolase
MHDNGQYSSGNFKTDAATQTAYALYLEKFVQGYAKAGITMDMITCQNEPTITSGGYPKCGWTPPMYIDFYKNYLNPRFTADGISTKILLGVYCCSTYVAWITNIMNDATVKNMVAVTSHSYQNPDWGPQAVAAYPAIPFWETEAALASRHCQHSGLEPGHYRIRKCSGFYARQYVCLHHVGYGQ